MALPRKPITKSHTTQNVAMGTGASGTLALMIALTLCKLLGIEPDPATLAALVTIISTFGGAVLARVIAGIRK